MPGRASAKRYGSPSRKRRPSWTSRFSVSSPDKVMRNGTSRSRGATPGQLVMPRTPPFGVVSLLADAASVTGDALAVRSPPSTSPASTSHVRAITNSGAPGWLWFTTHRNCSMVSSRRSRCDSVMPNASLSSRLLDSRLSAVWYLVAAPAQS